MTRSTPSQSQPRVWPAMCSTDQIDSVDVVEKAYGHYVVDNQGRHLLSANAGLWNASLGFTDNRILNAIRNQLDQLPYASLFRQVHPPAAELAEELVGLVPEWQISRVAYACSGSSAVDLALRICRRYHDASGSRRSRMLALSMSYHGTTTAAQAVSGEPMLQAEHGVDQSNTIFLPTPGAGCTQCLEQCTGVCLFDALERLEGEVDTIAGVILEPTIGSGGVIVVPTTVLDYLGHWCRERDVLIVADEVATGFGRCGQWFDWQRSTVPPDLVVTSKALNAGALPLAAVLIGQTVSNLLIDRHADLLHGETQAGNPLACAAALATITAMRDDNSIDLAVDHSEQLGAALEAALTPSAYGLHIERNGLMIGLHLPVKLRDKVPTMLQRIRNSGVIVHPSPLGLSLFPPYNLTTEDLEFLSEVVSEVILDEVGQKSAAPLRV